MVQALQFLAEVRSRELMAVLLLFQLIHLQGVVMVVLNLAQATEMETLEDLVVEECLEAVLQDVVLQEILLLQVQLKEQLVEMPMELLLLFIEQVVAVEVLQL